MDPLSLRITRQYFDFEGCERAYASYGREFLVGMEAKFERFLAMQDFSNAREVRPLIPCLNEISCRKHIFSKDR